ncbi:MAG: recombinase family protein [Candidatus Omnitrophota bacterium]|nr:recombinase family protein [Candidatus Omnitrophota bacterium]
MKAAIYARYSSENQSEKSIDDQVRVCRNYCNEHEITVSNGHIFIDEALSGSLVNRPGLQALDKAAENKEFEAVLVDDLSRLSRSNHQMLTLVLKFNYYQVKLISVSDGIISDDENSKLGIQMRGLINELYLDDLRKKTSRGLEGQKLRGFSAGENVYGYCTKPVGELRLNKKGQAKYDGMVHKINPEEAEIVKRIFKEFADNSSIHKIATHLNEDKTPTKKNMRGGWNVSTLSRILKNEKYLGKWNWRKTKNVRDPMTGKKKAIPRPEKERVPIFREDLIIIDKETWEKVKKRQQDLQGTWPVSKKKKAFYPQKSYVHTSPNHLLSGLMRCNTCGGAIVLMSGKGTGYYGCYNAGRKTCNNTLLIPRKRIEEIIIKELKENLLTTENLEYVYKNVEKIAAEGFNEVPELVKKKNAQYEKIQQEIQNYLNFIKLGNVSKAVSEALTEAEKNSDELKQEVGSLEFQKENSFKVPPKEWIKHRLENLRETLNKNTVSSSLALKELLGPISLEPILTKENDFYQLFSGDEKNFKPYCVAHSKIRTLALLDDERKGSNWLQWRRR